MQTDYNFVDYAVYLSGFTISAPGRKRQTSHPSQQSVEHKVVSNALMARIRCGAEQPTHETRSGDKQQSEIEQIPLQSGRHLLK
jgi:hypothetical protein